jgi:hypothetical protein
LFIQKYFVLFEECDKLLDPPGFDVITYNFNLFKEWTVDVYSEANSPLVERFVKTLGPNISSLFHLQEPQQISSEKLISESIISPTLIFATGHVNGFQENLVEKGTFQISDNNYLINIF